MLVIYDDFVYMYENTCVYIHMNVLFIHTCTCILYTHISTVYIMLFKWNPSIHYSSYYLWK